MHVDIARRAIGDCEGAAQRIRRQAHDRRGAGIPSFSAQAAQGALKDELQAREAKDGDGGCPERPSDEVGGGVAARGRYDGEGAARSRHPQRCDGPEPDELLAVPPKLEHGVGAGAAGRGRGCLPSGLGDLGRVEPRRHKQDARSDVSSNKGCAGNAEPCEAVALGERVRVSAVLVGRNALPVGREEGAL